LKILGENKNTFDVILNTAAILNFPDWQEIYYNRTVLEARGKTPGNTYIFIRKYQEIPTCQFQKILGNTRKYQEILGNTRKYQEIPTNIRKYL
jgi:hypothetical protein